MAAKKPAKKAAKKAANKPATRAPTKPAKKSAKKAAPAKARAKGAAPKALSTASSSGDGAKLLDARIKELAGWRGEMLAKLRRLIKEADPEVIEEAKWKKPSNPLGVPVWSHDGIICTGETYKDHVKLTFAKGAFVKDPARLFNASLDGNLRRGLDLYEGDDVDDAAFKELIRAAVQLNVVDARR